MQNPEKNLLNFLSVIKFKIIFSTQSWKRKKCSKLNTVLLKQNRNIPGTTCKTINAKQGHNLIDINVDRDTSSKTINAKPIGTIS